MVMCALSILKMISFFFILFYIRLMFSCLICFKGKTLPKKKKKINTSVVLKFLPPLKI